MRVLRRSVLGVVLALLAVSGFAVAATAPAPEPYELHAIVPETGGGAFVGKSIVEAYQAMELLVNATGGIQGHPLKIVLSDTQTSGQVVQLVNALIAEHVPVFIDGAPSTLCLASLPLVEKTGPVDYCLSPAVHPLAGGYVFTINGSTLDLTTVDFRYLRERGFKRIAVLITTDSNGQDYDRAIPLVMSLPENRDVRISGEEHFNNADISVAAQIARIKGTDAQAIFIVTTGPALGTTLRAIRDAGVGLPVLTIAPNMTYAQMATYKDYLPQELYFGGLRANTPNETLPGPLHDAQTVYGKAFKRIGVRPDAGQANAWDAGMIVIDALRTFGPSATSTQIHDYILHLQGWIGVNGVYDFTHGSSSGIGQNSMIVARWSPEKDSWVQVSRPGGYRK